MGGRWHTKGIYWTERQGRIITAGGKGVKVAGESPATEFKQDFPGAAREMGKKIGALINSGPRYIIWIQLCRLMAAAAAASAATATTAATATGAGEHGVVDYKPYLAAEVFHKVYGGFFQEGRAVGVHQEPDSAYV